MWQARAICALAEHFQQGKLSDRLLLDPAQTPEQVAALLTAVKGIGPWSANMFQMFSLQHPDVLPLGDLGVRKGAAKAFGLRGSGKAGVPDEKKDRDALLAAFEPYRPFRSLAAWYMWRVEDTPSFLDD